MVGKITEASGSLVATATMTGTAIIIKAKEIIELEPTIPRDIKIFENCMISKGYSKQIIENSEYDGSKIRNCKLPNGMEFKTTIQACKNSNGTTSGLW